MYLAIDPCSIIDVFLCPLQTYVVLEHPVSADSVNCHVEHLKSKVRLRKTPEKDKAELLANLELVRRRIIGGDEAKMDSKVACHHMARETINQIQSIIV